MSKLKINSDLFLGSQELNRFKKFLDDDGFRKLLLQDSVKFGLINNSKDGNFTNFRVERGTNVGTIKHADGLALNKFGNLITKLAVDNVAVPNDNSWYWIKIKHQYQSNELGTVSIDLSGNLTGTGTSFLSVLRGAPNNPSKVRFIGSSSNNGEYLVNDVINDSSAILSGDFIAESNLQLVVVGSFTPDVVPPSGNKDIFQYDGCLMTFVAETVSNTPPALLADEEFVIARVKRNGGTLSVEDKRSDIYRSKSEYLLTRISPATNPLIGVEAVKFNNIRTPRNENLVYVSWGFRSTNWTTDSSANRLTLIAGQGGKFKDTTYFTDGDFNGWRVYAKNSINSGSFSAYAIVNASTKSGTQINLILDYLDPTVFLDTAQELIVVPDADSIEIIFNAHPADATELTSQVFSYKINESFVRIPVAVYKATSCTYNVQYRLNTFGDYRKPVSFPSDPVGYLNESSFDANGAQTLTNRTAYTTHATNGFITLTEATNAYANRLSSIETGDLFGLQYVELNNASPIYTLEVGLSKQIQQVRTVSVGSGGLGFPYNLSVDHYINIKSTSSVGIKAGNSFLLRFTGLYGLAGFKIRLTQDYINSGSPGTILYTMIGTGNDSAGGLGGDYQVMQDKGLILKCTFDGTNWLAERFVEERGRLTLDAGSTNNARLELGSKEANTTPYIDFNSHGSTPSDYDVRVIASGGNGSVGNGTLNILASVLQINGVPITAGSTVTTARNLIAGAGLSGGGDLSADRTFDVNVDNSTVEISADTIRVKDLGITTAKIANGSVDNSKLVAGAAVANIGYTPANIGRNLIAGSGLSGGGDLSVDRTFDVNVDNSTIEISSDTLRLKDAGITDAKLAEMRVKSVGVQLLTKVIAIGDWNMNFSAAGSQSVNVAHGLGANYKKIRSVSAIVRDDTDTNYNSIGMTDSSKVYGGIGQIDGTNIPLVLVNPNAVFDNVNHDATSYNRGWVTVTYEA